MVYRPIKATAISLKPKKWDKDYNADKLETLFRQAAQDQPDLIVATEGVLEGYVVMDAIEHPEKVPAMLDIAEPLDGPYIQRFQALAQELGTCLCFGFAERIDDEVYNSAVFIDQEGIIRGKYHKTLFAEGTHASWDFNRIGRQIRAFDTPLGRVGMLICADRWEPMIARTLALDGAQLLVIVSYGSRKKRQNETVLARARENGLPIVEANVGMNLLISKGEVAAYKWGVDRLTTAVVEVPEPPSREAARSHEADYMDLQGPKMAENYQRTVERFQRPDAA